MGLSRIAKHLLLGPWHVRRLFPPSVLSKIEAAIAQAEQHTQGEIRFVVEATLTPTELFRGITPRDRAIEVFSKLRMWDTAHNTGVLIYLLLAERQFEIIADRGISNTVSESEWNTICDEMEAEFRNGRFSEGVLAGIKRTAHLLERHFPATGDQRNELPDQPKIFR